MEILTHLVLWFLDEESDILKARRMMGYLDKYSRSTLVTPAPAPAPAPAAPAPAPAPMLAPEVGDEENAFLERFST